MLAKWVAADPADQILVDSMYAEYRKDEDTPLYLHQHLESLEVEEKEKEIQTTAIDSSHSLIIESRGGPLLVSECKHVWDTGGSALTSTITESNWTITHKSCERCHMGWFDWVLDTTSQEDSNQ